MATMLIRQVRRTVGLLWVALVLALLGLVAVNTLGPKLGYDIFIIRGGSMAPAIPLGSLVAVTPTAAGSLSVGDVITIRGSNGIVYTHRIDAVDASGSERQFQVRGDANATPDVGMVPASAVIGRVAAYAPLLGYLTAMLSMPTGIVSIMSSLAALLLAYWLLEDLQEAWEREPEPAPDPEAPPTPAPKAVRA